VATSATGGNTFTVVPGQAAIGAKVEPLPQIASGRLTAAGGFAVGGYPPTVTIGAGAGTVGSVSGVTGYDQAASFTLVAGTANIQAGTLATVTFGQQMDVAPVAAIVSMYAPAGTLGIAVGAFGLSKSGFSIGGQAPASGVSYTVNWFVVRSPL